MISASKWSLRRGDLDISPRRITFAAAKNKSRRGKKDTESTLFIHQNLAAAMFWFRRGDIQHAAAKIQRRRGGFLKK